MGNKGDTVVMKPAHRKLSSDDIGRIVRLHADGASQEAIGAAVGCSQPTVSLVLKRYRPTVDMARVIIEANAKKSARAWAQAVPIAAKKGDHRPAKDLLATAGVVAPEHTRGLAFTINVGVGLRLDSADPFDVDPPRR